MSGSTLSPAFFINATTQHVGLFTNTPQATLDVNGNVIIEGNLTVTGTTTSTSTTTINLDNLTITLAETVSPTDTTANGAGLLVQGASTKSWLWEQSNSAWTSTENINLATGKTFKINGFDVVTGSALGSVITSAPGLSSVGTLASLNVANLSINGSTLAATSSNTSITIAPTGTGTINANSAKITSLGTPSSGTDAANKAYVDNSTQSAPLAIALTTTGLTNTQVASVFLSVVFPNTEHTNNTICRVVCTDLGSTVAVTGGSFVTGVAYMIVSTGSTTFTSIGASSNSVGTIFVATGPGSGSGTAAPILREFQLISGTWTFQSNL